MRNLIIGLILLVLLITPALGLKLSQEYYSEGATSDTVEATMDVGLGIGNEPFDGSIDITTIEAENSGSELNDFSQAVTMKIKDSAEYRKMNLAMNERLYASSNNVTANQISNGIVNAENSSGELTINDTKLFSAYTDPDDIANSDEPGKIISGQEAWWQENTSGLVSEKIYQEEQTNKPNGSFDGTQKIFSVTNAIGINYTGDSKNLASITAGEINSLQESNKETSLFGGTLIKNNSNEFVGITTGNATVAQFANQTIIRFIEAGAAYEEVEGKINIRNNATLNSGINSNLTQIGIQSYKEIVVSFPEFEI